MRSELGPLSEGQKAPTNSPEEPKTLSSQDGRRLRVLNPTANWAEQQSVPLPARVGMATALADGSGMVVLTEDGRVWIVNPQANAPSRS